ncbi:hypothetical protein D6C90_04979 [Aureobasidium pullulans]|uniref:Voltage-gated hydrogen channel 1 n=2 Tax=Aureobasidium pullulans TaxID=5580 RepID=A0A074XVV1_AURPU|nr:uncharacterized protein M438DRAFT_394808 [Aureobasidium pullulans EXF-150]THW02183.1 hypothetical protein D6D26_04507 [Aureobasidium pullulans]KEQ87749.1 hypothetical protein M438DRAFT_394808 [Aureobasidium pullulans EXF-150]THW40035.1 hypothetical protein D6D22_05998 [Aureobasidium pullulans]THW52309.1 hypothetical protein D6D21_01046 [Aureobasidium pullulans]THW86131.1 hypothetical protein D6D15_07584 [Aureobasidium pullulans]
MDDSRRPLLRESSPERTDSTFSTARRCTRRYLNSKFGHYAILLLVCLDCSCIFGEFVIQILTCEGRVSESKGDVAQEAIGIVGLVFSCLFMLELMASIWAFGFQYFRSKFHCFDATVIVASFVIDVLLRGILEEVASLVIILRLWRVIKIMEELSVGAQEQTEALRERIELLEHEKSQMEIELSALKANRTQESYA